MNWSPTELLTVYLEMGERRKVGRLAYRKRQVLFEFDPEFLASGIEISPLKLPLKPGVFTSPDAVFEGLYGVFNDSLPDGWGRLLLDRMVEKHGVRRGQLNALDRLAFVGRGGMGALSYEPERGGNAEADGEGLVLDRLAAESAVVLSGAGEDVFGELLELSGSSSGARPKIVAQVREDRKKIIHGAAVLTPGFGHWVIKFASSHDADDIGAIEYAYSLMAKAAGVVMPETHLFRTRKGRYFGAKRFDRHGDRRVHMHSLSGLIHADHRVPAQDYDMILRVVSVLTKNVAEVEKAYALACFNVLAHNRDDHAKNFSFLMNDDFGWVFGPAYDLTFSDGPAGEQSTMVMGEGRNPGVENLVALGKAHGLRKAPRILAGVREAVGGWRDFARAAGVSRKSAEMVAGGILPARAGRMHTGKAKR